MAWQGSDRRRRLPPDWERRRRRILRRDNHRCQLNYPGCTGHANEVDHITAGDDHHDANLQAACSACHSRKSAAEGVAARRPLAPRTRRPERHPGTLQ